VSGLWQKTMMYLGLVDEDAADDVDDARVKPARAQREPARTSSTGETPRVTRSTRDPEARSDIEYGRPARDRAEDGPQVTRRIQPTVQGQVAGRRVEPPLTARRRVSSNAGDAEAGIYVQSADTPTVRTVKDSDLECEIITARSYSDAQALADHIRANIPVVLDLRKVEPAMVRRLVDFASGLTYALGGSMRKIGQGVILVSPANVNISRSERRRLAEMGFYQSPEG
jgi:FtsZ-interacting cell division protein YlmF